MIIDNSCPLWGTGGKTKKYYLCIPIIRNEIIISGIFFNSIITGEYKNKGDFQQSC